MPTYEYECAACAHQFEEFQKITADPIKTCPECSEDKVRRLISASAFHLKGSGWYKTDYASSGGGSTTGSPASDKPDSQSKDSAGKDSTGKDSAKTDGVSKDSVSKDSVSKDTASKGSSSKSSEAKASTTSDKASPKKKKKTG